MKIFKGKYSVPVRRDVTAPTSVVYITRIVSTKTAVDQPTEGNPTVTVLKTITASSAASAVATTKIPSIITYTESISHPSSSTVAVSNIYFAVSSTTIPEITTTASLPSSAAATSLLGSNISSDSSTRLGLAIGIPIAVVSVFGLVVFFLIYLRKRMDMNPEEEIAFKARKTENMRPTLERQSVSSMHSTSDLEQGPDTKLSNYTSYKNQQYTSEAKPNLLKRISRLMNIPDSPMEFKSPIFLRRFHLSSNKNEAQIVMGQEKVSPNSPLSQVIHNAKTPYEVNDNKVEPKLPQWESLNLPACPESTYVVVKPYARRLGDELSVCIGEKVTVVDHHSDGWASVKMVESRNIGVIPLMCIKKVLNK